MCLKSGCLCHLLVLISLVLKAETRIEFTNFVCTTFDKMFGEYEYCYIKSINRSYKYISGKFNVYQLPVTNFIYGTIRDYTNINHTCPFNHGVTLDKLPTDFVNDRFTRVLPFPTGDYLLKIHWLIGNFLTASAEVYGTLS